MKSSSPFIAILITACLCISATVVHAINPTVNMQQARQAAENWLDYYVSDEGSWGDADKPTIRDADVITNGDDTLGYYFDVNPQGYILCPASNLLPPIKAYSTSHGLQFDNEHSFGNILRGILLRKTNIIDQYNGNLSLLEDAGYNSSGISKHQQLWKVFNQDQQEFFESFSDNTDDLGPLLSTIWHQGDPYNQMCPEIGGENCVVGCVATAAAQIMKYHNWPPSGESSNSYQWQGQTLSATFSDTYDWGNMLNSYGSSATQTQIDAVAELCFEVGVAFELDYGLELTSLYMSQVGNFLTVYPEYFRYSDEIDREDRVDYTTAQEWFAMIQNQINAYQPMQYQVVGHSIVCDGWRLNGDINQIHLNYGWGGAWDNWYAVDELHLGNPDEEFLIRQIIPSGTEVSGDVSGTWTAENSPYLVTGDITVTSAQNLIIEPGVDVIFQGNYQFIVNGLLHAMGMENDSITFSPANTSEGWEGIAFYNQDASKLGYCVVVNAGSLYSDVGILCENDSLAINNCRISNNSGTGINCLYSNPTISHSVISENGHWGINCYYSNPLLENNIIYANSIGVYCNFSDPEIINCLIIENDSHGISYLNWSDLILKSTGIIANSGEGIGSNSAVCTLFLTNCIVWGNSYGIGAPIGTVTVSYSDIQGGWTGQGNINQNPLFVPGSQGNYYLSQTAAGQAFQSPCVDAGDPTSQMIIGTTRTDGIQDEGIIDMGYHYNYGGFIIPELTVVIEPVNPPIVISQTGGSFEFDLTLDNSTTQSETFDLWCTVEIPAGAQFTVLGPLNLTLPAGANITRLRSQLVPEHAPGGEYTFWAFIGEHPWIVDNLDFFNFTKEGTDSEWISSDGWLCTGESFAGEELLLQDAIPTDFALLGAYPNPFNPTTTISFELRDASSVLLNVFDIQGREVARLVNGWREAGQHEVTFDASNLASGMYFYQIQAGEFSAVKKMVLVK